MWYSGVATPVATKLVNRVLLGTTSRKRILLTALPSMVTATGAASPVPVLERFSVNRTRSPGLAVLLDDILLTDSTAPGPIGGCVITWTTLELVERELPGAGEYVALAWLSIEVPTGTRVPVAPATWPSNKQK